MVSFWPWKGDDSSPASFEKTLSTLSAKISKTSNKLDGLRQRSRRLNVLWTLYAGFAYLLYSIILALVVGWRSWGIAEYAAVTGGPIIIYLIRLTLATYYGYRTSSVQARLEELQKQRDSTIEKLKTATRYNSTQEILKRYGGTPTPKVKTAVATDRKTTSRQGDTGTPKDRRTTFVPPPTANIPRRNEPIAKFDMSQSSPPQSRGLVGQQDQYPAVGLMPPSRRPSSPQDTSAEFAPNAFSAAPQYAQVNEGSRWYDRIMDVLLGEDETLPRARLALICNDCRLVNGQAPPGIKRLEDVGEWRCGGCGTMNGEESEARKIVANLKEQNSSERERTGKKKEYRSAPADQGIISEPVLDNADEGHESDVTQYSSESADEDRETEQINEKAADPAAEPETPRRRSTRPRGHSKDVR